MRRAAEDQLADRHAAGVEASDEGRHGARRHERARAIHIADRLRHGLAHVGAGMEHQLHERRALDALALDVIDAGDVEEVILVVVSQVAFHLRRVHAAVGLRDIDGRIADLRENIDGHALDGERPRTARWRRRATTTVIGRLSAARTRRMIAYWLASAMNGWISPAAVATPSRPRQTPSRASASSISACVSSRCASATSSMFPSPD